MRVPPVGGVYAQINRVGIPRLVENIKPPAPCLGIVDVCRHPAQELGQVGKVGVAYASLGAVQNHQPPIPALTVWVLVPERRRKVEVVSRRVNGLRSRRVNGF